MTERSRKKTLWGNVLVVLGVGAAATALEVAGHSADGLWFVFIAAVFLGNFQEKPNDSENKP